MTCKHFAGYDLENWGGNLRYGFNAIISLQDLAEFYLPGFERCARDLKVGSIMCSYNAVNGTPACANSYLMGDILRDHWNWTEYNQYITSDCAAITDIQAYHHYVATNAEAVAVALKAGTDIVCTANTTPNVTGAYTGGYLSEATLDQALKRRFEGLVRVGYFDFPTTSGYASIGWSAVGSIEAQKLAVQSASSGFVLLKNDGFLPSADLANKNVAMIGMWANATQSQLLGGYSGIPPYLHNPLYAAEALNISYTYATGPINETTTDTWTSAALAAAEKADVILYWGGIDSTIEAEGMDRNSITWPSPQLKLIDTLSSLGKPVVVLQMGDVVDHTPLLNNSNISAIIWTGYSGQSGGTAAFDILTGTTAPAGRLPVTLYPGNYVNEVAMTDMSLRPSSNNPGRTYRWYDDAVLPFAYGLHYTNFTASFTAPIKLSYNSGQLSCGCKTEYQSQCPFTSIGVTVKNTGDVTSDYVATVFVTGEYGPTPYPLKTLVAYYRFHDVAGGETQQATLNLTLGDLTRFDEFGNKVLYPGNYTLLLDVPTQDNMSFAITGNESRFETWPQPPPPPANSTIDGIKVNIAQN